MIMWMPVLLSMWAISQYLVDQPSTPIIVVFTASACRLVATFLRWGTNGRHKHCARGATKTKRNRPATDACVMPLPGPCHITIQTRHFIPVSKLHDIASARFFDVAWSAVKYLLLLGALHYTACTVLSWLPNVLSSQTW